VAEAAVAALATWFDGAIRPQATSVVRRATLAVRTSFGAAGSPKVTMGVRKKAGGLPYTQPMKREGAWCR